MLLQRTTLLAALVLFGSLGGASADEIVIDGVLGLAPSCNGAGIAIWVPLQSGEMISGVTWYNNDSTHGFPSILVVDGEPGVPARTEDAIAVAENVSGPTGGWGQCDFSQPVATLTSGIYVIFGLPGDADFVGAGNGPGFGFVRGGEEVTCWATAGEEWDSFAPAVRVAIEPIVNANKGGNVLVLGGEGADSNEQDGGDLALPTSFGALTASPNPFNPQTEISFTIDSGREVHLAVFDLRGRLVKVLLDEDRAPGLHSAIWNGRDDSGRAQPSGVYLAVMRAGAEHSMKRLTLVQ
jgi:hypothetical protein